jgi:hypothetical protein
MLDGSAAFRTLLAPRRFLIPKGYTRHASTNANKAEPAVKVWCVTIARDMR